MYRHFKAENIILSFFGIEPRSLICQFIADVTRRTEIFGFKKIEVYGSNFMGKRRKSSSSPLTRQPMVGPGLLKKLCPFVSVEGDPLPILDF